jgi:filamentous hemagglutinin family protein
MPRLAARATPVRALTYQPALAGFRPAAAAIAVATAFALPVTLRAQPVGGQAVAGQASFVRNGANLLVTTQNAAGSNHSAINWQSFSVPLGSVTQFNQPSATSTSINRVLGSDPSSIFGTLSSNGRLVLVNPAGIAVGKGAVVDTAGFTASTLPMSEADAIAGRLRFAGNGGSLQVDGSIVARSGDVVLIAPSVQAGTDAVVQSSGATVLAAGQKVEITGRGLEGIHLEVQAPGNQAVNLGTLKGDAVGIFAGTLKHSGLVQAQAVTSEGGKVLLKAQGDNLVSGAVQGRSIDVLGERVGLLAGAAVDASGAQGGGQVRIGGDYQGKNPDVPNAKRTYVDAQATIKADAAEAGNGGRVIVWSDEATRMQGRISARGGAQGGDGGFVEVSGKQYLEFAGRADTRAPQGKAGMLLLDPNDIEINATGPTDTANAGGGEFSGGSGTSFVKDADLSAQLELGNVLVTTTPGSLGPLGGQITLAVGANVNWTAGTWLALQADKGIQLDGVVTGYGLSLHAMDGGIVGTGPLRVSQLYANAIAGSSTDPNAGKVLLTGANLVGTVAGHADRAFTFTNGGALSVGYVSSSNGYGDGINSSGPVSVTTAGDLTVESESSTSGNTVSLVSNGGSVYLGGSADVSASGRLDIRAATDVTAGGYVYISAGGGAAGGIHINAGTGNVDFGSSGFSLNSYQSPIEVTAGNSIVSSGVSYNSYGTVDGWIQLTASGGSISYGNIYASGSSGSFSVSDGGKVTLKGRTGVSGGDIASTGGSLYTSAGSGASGGEVFVESAEGSIQVGSVSTYGGSASSSSLGIGMGGTGGNVTLQSLATTPATVTAAYVSARGGNGYGDKGGTGGTVIAKAPGDIQLVNVDAGGGD